MTPLYRDAPSVQHALATTPRSYFHADVRISVPLPLGWYEVPCGKRDDIEIKAVIHRERMARVLAWLGTQP